MLSPHRTSRFVRLFRLPTGRRFFIFCIIFCGLLGLSPVLLTYSFAEVGWLEQVKTCKDFEERVEDYHRQLPELSGLSIRDRQQVDSEISQILRAACSARFTQCKFDSCVRNSIENGTDLQTRGLEPGEAMSKQATQSTDADRTKKTDSTIPHKRKFGENIASDKDPLAWLKLDWDCEGFKEQIEVRYQVLGNVNLLPEAKKAELDVVLQEACSKRFANCKFEHCKNWKR